jgi:hypothetical protein
MNTLAVGSDPALAALRADGPWPDYGEKMMLYGQFVGDWEFDWTGFDADGKVTLTTKGEWVFTRVLEGRAIQDVWICRSREVRGTSEAPAAKGEYATTVRFYDPSIDAWRVVWTGPGYGNLRTFFAHAERAEIVQEGWTPEGQPLHWIFSDIAEHSFDWRSQVRQGAEWRLLETMVVRRR